jgi:hypothetical protein
MHLEILIWGRWGDGRNFSGVETEPLGNERRKPKECKVTIVL